MHYHRAEYLGLTNKEGKARFFLYWMSDFHIGHPLGEHRKAERGQIFNAVPSEYKIPSPEQVKCPMCQSDKKSVYRDSLSCGKCGSKIVGYLGYIQR